MFGLSRAAKVIDYEKTLPLPLEDNPGGGGVTYKGYCEDLGTKTSEPKWLIIRITIASGVTTPEYAGGNGRFEHIWDDRASLNYSR